MFPQVKTQLSLSQHNFLVIGTHLTVAWLWKTGIPEDDPPYCIMYIPHIITYIVLDSWNPSSILTLLPLYTLFLWHLQCSWMEIVKPILLFSFLVEFSSVLCGCTSWGKYFSELNVFNWKKDLVKLKYKKVIGKS